MSAFEIDSTSAVQTAQSDNETGGVDASLSRQMASDSRDRLESQRRKSNAGAQRSPNEANISQRTTPPGALASLYAPIADSLLEVERLFDEELRSGHESLREVLRHGTQLGGKRMRPAILLLSGQAVGAISNDHVVLGTVVEMVHTATLVHDDVLDQADTRRHVPTVNARWDEHTSILLGDYLFAQSFRLAATLPSTEACRMIGEAARLVCEGELRQVLGRDVIEMDRSTYYDVIRGKTAELCRVACKLGAKFAGGDESIATAMGHYGESLGIAFQIADDFLDLWGDHATVGKTLGTDLAQGKMTLPLIRVMEVAPPRDRDAIIQILEGPADLRFERIWPYLERSDAREFTRSIAEEFKQQAVEALDCLSPGTARESLLQIASFSVDRRF